jgi:hypothetical protein
MGFTIERIYSATFEPCVGWPKEVDYSELPELTEKLPVVNGHFESSLTGEMKLDNFTGYVTLEYRQERCTGDMEDREEKRRIIQENNEKVLSRYAGFMEVKNRRLYLDLKQANLID